MIRVPLPEELARSWPQHINTDDGTYTRHLIAATGFEPGFVRVKGFEIPGSNDIGPNRGHYDSWNSCGYPDVPGGDGHPNGRGGEIYGLVRGGQFEIGSSGWADKSGTVHST